MMFAQSAAFVCQMSFHRGSHDQVPIWETREVQLHATYLLVCSVVSLASTLELGVVGCGWLANVVCRIWSVIGKWVEQEVQFSAGFPFPVVSYGVTPTYSNSVVGIAFSGVGDVPFLWRESAIWHISIPPLLWNSMFLLCCIHITPQSPLCDRVSKGRVSQAYKWHPSYASVAVFQCLSVAHPSTDGLLRWCDCNCIGVHWCILRVGLGLEVPIVCEDSMFFSQLLLGNLIVEDVKKVPFTSRLHLALVRRK